MALSMNKILFYIHKQFKSRYGIMKLNPKAQKWIMYNIVHKISMYA